MPFLKKNGDTVDDGVKITKLIRHRFTAVVLSTFAKRSQTECTNISVKITLTNNPINIPTVI